jgi:hypothetical protein
MSGESEAIREAKAEPGLIRCVQVRICLVMVISPRGAITGAHQMWRSYSSLSRVACTRYE